MSDERTLDMLETKIKELHELNKTDGIDLSSEIVRLEKKLAELRKEMYSHLSEWERVKLARHPGRPHTLDYIKMIFEGFYELHGDRLGGDDPGMIAGLAKLAGRAVAVIGQQKGRSTEENKRRNFGMPRPQGYRKARRVMKLAERFSFPVITLIDTPGAYPGLESEEGNIGEAIAVNLETMAQLRAPIISVVIGEGGSGGALAIGVADRILMLENAIYSVISPEGAAAILWKDKERARAAAAALNLTAPRLHELGAIDAVVPEPLGGAHKDPKKTGEALKDALLRNLSDLDKIPIGELVTARYDRYRGIGRYRTLTER